MEHIILRAPQPGRRALKLLAAGESHGQNSALMPVTPPAYLLATPTNEGLIHDLPGLNSTYYLVGFPTRE
jgi:hypothetical protein